MRDGEVAQERLGLVGRDRELAEITAILEGRGRLPAQITVIGEPGIGKSTIWEAAGQAGAVLGYRLLESRPAESEASLAFTALGDLLGGVLPLVAPALPPQQRRALEAALLLGGDDLPRLDHRTVGVAVLSALRLLADERAVLLAIDDEQWLDAASAGILGFALRRLRDERVAVLTARRQSSGTRSPDGVSRQVDSRLPTTTISLGGLSLGALHAIVADRLGAVMPRPRLRRLHELSRGNPFLALELLRAAASGRLDLDAAAPVAPDLDRLVGARLDDLPQATRSVLLVAAAASRPDVPLLTLAVGIDVDLALAPARAAAIVELSGDEIRFSHPLIASAAYAAASAAERRDAHARLAALVDEPVERARHLALSTAAPDASVASEVERAADSVFRRGAPGQAAVLAEQSARLTPAGDQAAMRRRRAAEAEYLFEAGDTAAAAGLVEALVDSTQRGVDRARLLALLARIRHFHDDIGAGTALNELALADASNDDRLTAGIHEGLAWGRFLMRDDLSSAARHARKAVQAADRAGDDVPLGEALAVKAVTALAIGRRDDAALDRAMTLEPAFRDLRVLRHPSYARGYVLACLDRVDAARSVFVDLLDRAEVHGDESAVPSILVQLSMVEIQAGNWAGAADLAERGEILAEQGSQRPSQAALRGRRALLAVLQGRPADGQALAEQALAFIDGGAGKDGHVVEAVASTSSVAPFARGGEVAMWALGAAHLARADFAAAHACLQPLTDALLGSGLREPGELRFLPDAVDARLGLGDGDGSARIAGEMEAMAAAPDRDLARALAARSRALVLAHEGHLEAAVSAAAKAVRWLEPGPLPFELARSRFVLGSLLRRQRSKRDARDLLSAARSAFQDLGAVGWAANAQAEVDRIGGRTASASGLTTTEARVAELVAEGLANKEIAAALGVSTKTVELHLSHAYAKLDVGSRTELVRRLAAGIPGLRPG